jgi:hypothetical protein
MQRKRCSSLLLLGRDHPVMFGAFGLLTSCLAEAADPVISSRLVSLINIICSLSLLIQDVAIQAADLRGEDNYTTARRLRKSVLGLTLNL